MATFDLILLIFLGCFALYGFYLGLVRMILNIISSILSIIIAVNLYLDFYNIFPFIGFKSESMGKTLSFIIVLVIVNFLLSLVFNIIAKVLKIITSLPVISFINRIFGGVLGLIQGFFILGVIVFVASRYAITNNFLNSLITGSDFAPFLLKIINWITPFIPTALKMLESAIK